MRQPVRLFLVVAGAVALFAATAGHAATPTKLQGTVGPGFTITLKKAGRKVTSVKAGTYTIIVADRSNIHNFHLRGTGVNKNSGVGATGTKTWRVTLRKGTYRYVCDPHASTMKGSFRVT